VLELKPDAAEIYELRSIAWFGKKDYDKAWADIKRFRDAGGTPNPDFVDTLKKASGRSK